MIRTLLRVLSEDATICCAQRQGTHVENRGIKIHQGATKFCPVKLIIGRKKVSYFHNRL